jgi:predicted  nucleic acid-binding Zn-ribbon protein
MPNQNQGSLQMELDSQQKELTDINRRSADIKSNLARDEALFAESKHLIERKQQDIQDLGRECETLAHKNFQISIKAQQAAELTEDLTALRSEREALEKSITQITSLPFTRNQSGEPSTV